MGQLNDAQKLPVQDTEGAVLVLAGAGSGKTRVLTMRIAYLIGEKGVSPHSILAITFTNKAAKEMRERIDRMTGSYGMWVSTIHSMCARILRKNADLLGYTDKFSIYTDTEQRSVLKRILKELDYDDEKLIKKVKWHISNAKMLALDPEAYSLRLRQEHDRDEEAVTRVYRQYRQQLRTNNAMDFDDLLSETDALLRAQEPVRREYAERFRYILVDEFQDTNAVQLDIIRQLASVHGNLFAVGDDDQSIYGWRGADIENILSFEKIYPDAKVYKLEQNYRSTQTVLDLANEVISRNRKRKEKKLWTENGRGTPAKAYEARDESEEARFVAGEIERYRKMGASYSDFAVLMRINALTRSFEQEFGNDGIPYRVYGGFRFYERKEIKDILAYMRIIANPFDSEAVMRVINVPKRGIGESTLQALTDYAERTGLTVYDALLDADSLPLQSRAKTKLQAFSSLLKELILLSQELPLNELVRQTVTKTQMREAYAEDTDENLAKRANIDEFVSSVEDYVRLNPDATLDDYLNQTALSSDTDDISENDCVTLATIHSVKGLEFKCVFICGLEEGVMPISRAADDPDEMEEERRLMYVAITRAQEKVYFTRARSRYMYGKRDWTARSVFLKELAADLGLPRERSPYGSGGSSFHFGDEDGEDDEETYGNGRRPQAGRGSYGSRASYGSYGSPYGGGSGGSAGYGSGGSKAAGSGDTYRMPQTRGAPVRGSAARGGGAGAKAAAAGAQGGQAAYAEGMRVRHKKFGEGVVKGVRGSGPNVIVMVDFGDKGVKELSARLAPMEVLR